MLYEVITNKMLKLRNVDVLYGKVPALTSYNFV